jgi:photosystem II stability/assembly factor-like uncharacterized protein
MKEAHMSDKSRINFALLSTLATVILMAFAVQRQEDRRVAFAAKPNDYSPDMLQSSTLLEAWDIFDAYGREWNNQSAIVLIQSIDVTGDTSASGQDGRRRGWMAVIASQDESLWMRLVEGAVTEETAQPLSTGLTPLVRPNTDSPQALSLARTTKPEFESSKDRKAQGYHFALSIAPTGLALISVLGAVEQRPARIQLDPYTNIMLSAQIYTYAPTGGILYSTDAGEHWQASTVQGKMITALAPDPTQEGWAYAVAVGQDNICIYQTKDGGVSWEWMGDLPQQAGDWPFDLLALRDPTGSLVLLVGTWNGLWISTGGQDWAQAKGLPQGPAQWLAAAQSTGENRLFITISSGESRGLYSSTDLSRWIEVADKVYRLSESFDSQMVIAISENERGQGLLLDVQGENVILLPESVLQAAGDFQSAAPILFRSPTAGVGVAQMAGGKTIWTLSAPVASLITSPDFPASQLAIAGGFRTGIYRTTDGGQNWEQVLLNPSDILPGSDEIYEVVFLSPKAVIAVNGGKLAWQDF